ncbi:MAG TPA: DNA polymerase Y family protein [Candidatus Sulfotelmatobacter sp.]|jgi:protein ImuB
MSIDRELYACLYAEEFPAQALLRVRVGLRNRACAVMDGEPPLGFVCSLNRHAYEIGIVRGTTQAEIDTFPQATILTRSKVEEASAKAALLECAGTFSPRVEDASSDGEFLCVIDIVGTEKLFGSPGELAETLLKRAHALGIAARIAVSGNFHAAICLVRGAPKNPITVIPAGAEASTLAPLPLSVLGLSEELAGTFSLWGIRTLGMLAALPEKSLIARVGQEGRRIFQMARGEFSHHFLPVENEFRLEERMELEVPVELLTSLLFVIDAMLEQLTIRASAHALALATVTVTLSLEGGAQHTRAVHPALPSNDRQLWIKLLHLDMEAHPPQAAIIALTVSAEPGKTGKVQLGLFSPPLPEPARLDVTLARVRAIVGEKNVGRPELKDTHRPDAYHLAPFSVQPAVGQHNMAHPSRTVMRQLRPPEQILVTLRDHKPASIFFRGKHYFAEQAYGPWLSSGDWWNPQLWGFEQWDLIARSRAGELLYGCLVRDLRQNCWQLAGLYD